MLNMINGKFICFFFSDNMKIVDFSLWFECMWLWFYFGVFLGVEIKRFYFENILVRKIVVFFLVYVDVIVCFFI